MRDSSLFSCGTIAGFGIGNIWPEILLLHDLGVSLHHDLTVLLDICQVTTNGCTVTECFHCRVYEHVHGKISAAYLSIRCGYVKCGTHRPSDAAQIAFSISPSQISGCRNPAVTSSGITLLSTLLRQYPSRLFGEGSAFNKRMETSARSRMRFTDL